MIVFLLRLFALIAFLIAVAYLFIGNPTGVVLWKCLMVGLSLWVASVIPWAVVGDYGHRVSPPAQ